MFQPKKEDWHKQPYIAPHEKITVEEIENIFFGNLKKYPIINQPKEPYDKSYYSTVEAAEDSKQTEEKWGVTAAYLGLGVDFLWQERWNDFLEREAYEERKLKEEKYKKRLQARGIAKCLYKKKQGWANQNLNWEAIRM